MRESVASLSALTCDSVKSSKEMPFLGGPHFLKYPRPISSCHAFAVLTLARVAALSGPGKRLTNHCVCSTPETPSAAARSIYKIVDLTPYFPVSRNRLVVRADSMLARDGVSSLRRNTFDTY